MTEFTDLDGSELFDGDYVELLNDYIEEEVGVVIDEFLYTYLSGVDEESDFYRKHFSNGELNDRGLIFFGDVLDEYRLIIEREYPGGRISEFLEGSSVNRRGFSLLLIQMMKNAIERVDASSEMSMDSLMAGYVNKNSVPGLMAIKAKMLEMKLEGRVYGVVSCDLDYFKGVNDAYGHAIGDVVLRHVAAAIKGSVRDCFLIRAGGEELDLILDFNGDYETLLRIAERVRKTVDESPCYLKCKIDDSGAILNFEEIGQSEYGIVNSVTGETRKCRGIETVINERREGSTMRTMFLMIPVSLSVGVDLVNGNEIQIAENSESKDVTDSYGKMKGDSDNQCYLAKKAGRNRVYGNGMQFSAG